MAGLPAWVWGAALGGGLLVGLYLRHRSAAATDAAAGSDSAGADSGPNTDAGGDSMAGTASGDSADLMGMGELPGQAYTGFQGGSPPAYPPAEARIDPALLKTLRQIARAERREQRQEHHHGKGKGKGKGKHPKAHAAVGGHLQASRDVGQHYPAGTTSGVVR